MRQISSKLNMYVRSVGVINNNIEKLILNIIFWSFGALALLYILFLGNMVKNIVERRGLEIFALSLSNEVRDLELSYLSMSNGVDINLSHSLGFEETEAIFATRKPSLGLNSVGKPFGTVKAVQTDL